MKKKQNTQKQICSYILRQLQEKTNRRLTEAETAAFRIFWIEQDYQLTAYRLELNPHEAINLVQKAFEKLRVRKTTPSFRNEEDLLSAPIFIHPFTTRLYHVLRFMDCRNLYELLDHSKKELMSKRGFGEKAWQEIESYLKKQGLDLNELVK